MRPEHSQIRSGDSAAAPFDPELLEPYCKRQVFKTGDVLRQRGRYYRDLFLLTEGVVDVQLARAGDKGNMIERTTGAPIGEIGFLSGRAASADVVAKTTVCAFVISDADLYAIEAADGALAVKLSRYLGATLEERLAEDQLPGGLSGALTPMPDIEMLMCRTDEMMQEAQHLRYRVYCEELGRDSPYADHKAKIIRDDLDDFGHTFVARRNNETVGTIRGNLPTEGHIGLLEDLYGMSGSQFHPSASCIATKFIVSRSERGGDVAMRLFGAITGYAVDQNVREAYIDCVPALLPYYRSMGFRIAAEKFLHYENGPSHPLVLDVTKHGKRLSGAFGPLRMAEMVLKAKAFKLLHLLIRPR